MAPTPLFAWTAPQWQFPGFINVSNEFYADMLTVTLRGPALHANGDDQTPVVQEGPTVVARVPALALYSLIHGDLTEVVLGAAASADEDDPAASVRLKLDVDETARVARWTLEAGGESASFDMPADVVAQMRTVLPIVAPAPAGDLPSVPVEPEGAITVPGAEPTPAEGDSIGGAT